MDGLCPCRPLYLNTSSLLAGVFWGDYGTFGRLSLAGGSKSLGLGFEGLWSHPTFPSCFLGFLCEDENVIFQVPSPGCCHTFITIKDLLSENISQNKLLSWYLITATKTKPIQSPAEILSNSQQDSYAVAIYTNAKDLK